ncbi:hypothetical protein [Spirosoma flavus]
MTLHFSVADSDSPCVCCAELEILMDVLNSFVAMGNVILSAYLIDDDGFRMDLPVAAFDGLPIANSVQGLVQQYQQLVSV